MMKSPPVHGHPRPSATLSYGVSRVQAGVSGGGDPAAAEQTSLLPALGTTSQDTCMCVF